MRPADRRVRMRIPARFKVDYFHQGNFLISYSNNISVEGMFICTENPPPVGTCLTLVFSIGDVHELSVGAKVAWVNPSGSPGTAGIGVQFMQPPSMLKETILQLVNRVAVLEKETCGM